MGWALKGVRGEGCYQSFAAPSATCADVRGLDCCRAIGQRRRFVSVFLCLCVFQHAHSEVLNSTLDAKLAHCIALLHIHSCVQADPPSQSSAQQRCQQTHCGPPLTTITAFDWTSGFSQTLARPHFLETHVHTLRRIQRILCSEARARTVHRVLFACCRQRCFFWIR